MNKNIQRSDVVNFYELTEEQQAQAIDTHETEAEEMHYIIFNDEAYSLGQFMRTGNEFRRHGVMHLTNTSGLSVTLSKCNTQAIVELIY